MKASCRSCSMAFEISDQDLAFYKKVSPIIGGISLEIPPPTLCPDCRCRRRLLWRNERTLYKRQCDFSGKQMMSMYAPDSPYRVYDYKEWYSDKWDPLEYGQEIDFGKPFFTQWAELLANVPVPSLNFQAESENCEYTNFTTSNKNCYLVFAASDDEDCYYSTYAYRNRKVVDSFFMFDSDTCYECIDSYNCNALRYSQNCENCSDSLFLFNCRGCVSCVGCVGLVQKKYHIFNQPCTPEECAGMAKKLGVDPVFLQETRERFQALKLTLPHKYYSGIGNQSVSGDHVSYSRESYDCYDCLNLENCRYCTWMHKAKDCYDCYAWGMTGELGYENHLCGNTYHHVCFSDSCWGDTRELLYCRYCVSGTRDSFGCIGLKRKQYCILNKQYSEGEYNKLVPKLIKHMRHDGGAAMNPRGATAVAIASGGTSGSWGEFFPESLAPFGYNETVAQEYFPLSQQEATSHGWQWKRELPHTMGRETLSWDRIPWPIADIPDAITQEILACNTCQKNFRIIPQELAFYREMNLPLPRMCFDCRYRARRDLRNPRKLSERECAQCKKTIATSYAPERPETVYCESCYLAAIY